jgi:GNAT superfamily N-acetyltransferase
MVDYTLRKYRTDDTAGLTQLAKTVLEEELPDTYWEWKYTDNRWGSHYSYVAEHDGKVIGFVGGMAWQLTLEGLDTPGAQVADLIVDPAWRRKGIFYKLSARNMEEISTGTAWGYGVTNRISHKIYKNRYEGYQDFRPHKIQKILNIRPFLREYLKGGARVKPAELGRLLRKFSIPRREMRPPCDLELEEITSFDERFDDLWSRVRKDFRIISTRDRKHLNWRYSRNPRFDYTVLAATEKGRVTGYIVLRIEQTPRIGRGFIVDFLADASHEATAPFLIGESLTFFRRRRVAVVNTWMFEHCWPYDVFASFGFSPRTAETVMIVIKSFTDAFSTEFLADRTNWYLSMGDCEVF